jgi:plasmid replication initiation protein
MKITDDIVKQVYRHYSKLPEPEKKWLKLLSDYFLPGDTGDIRALIINLAKKTIEDQLEMSIDAAMLHLAKLKSRDIEIKTPKESFSSGWVMSFSTADESECGDITIRVYNPDTKLFKKVLEYSERPDSEIANRLRGRYAPMLYHFLKQHEDRGEIIVEIPELKRILGLKPKEYSIYGNFKSQIIVHSQKEMNIASDIVFTFEEIKTNGKFSKFWFKIRKMAF